MYLCRYNVQLLEEDWALSLVENLNYRIDEEGNTALKLIFQAKKLPEMIFETDTFKILFNAEKDMLNKFKATTLMSLCTHRP